MEQYGEDYIYGKESLKKHKDSQHGQFQIRNKTVVKQLEKINRNALQALRQVE